MAFRFSSADARLVDQIAYVVGLAFGGEVVPEDIRA
jgi:hypothetical protein